MHAKMFQAGVFLSGVMLMAGSAQASRPCPPDINCSGGVDVSDLLSVINAWGQSGTPSDVNGSGTVEVGDLLAVINAWGPCVFDFGPAFPDPEVHQIGLEMLGPGGALTLSQQLYDRIERDLDLIRTAHPSLASQPHSPAWVPNSLLVNAPNPQAPDYLCHNAYYQVTAVSHLFSTWYVVDFAASVNVEALAQVYMADAGISFAEPDGFIGGQNFYEPVDLGNGTWRWNIDDGWHDCFDGCDCHNYYVIDVDAPGNVTLVSFQQIGQPWCQFK